MFIHVRWIFTIPTGERQISEPSTVCFGILPFGTFESMIGTLLLFLQLPSLKLTVKAPENWPPQQESSIPTIYF